MLQNFSSVPKFSSGSTWLVIKVGYGGLGPFNVAALRFVIAGSVFVGFEIQGFVQFRVFRLYRAGAGLKLAGSRQFPSNGGQFGTGVSGGG